MVVDEGGGWCNGSGSEDCTGPFSHNDLMLFNGHWVGCGNAFGAGNGAGSSKASEFSFPYGGGFTNGYGDGVGCGGGSANATGLGGPRRV